MRHPPVGPKPREPAAGDLAHKAAPRLRAGVGDDRPSDLLEASSAFGADEVTREAAP